MKKHLLLLTLAVMTITSIVYAQEEGVFDYQFGTITKDGKTRNRIEVVAKMNNGYAMLKRQAIRGPGGYKYHLVKLDDNLKELDFKDISENIAEDDFDLEKVVVMSNSFIILSKKHYKDEKMTRVYAQYVDLSDFSVTKREQIFEEEITGRAEKLNFITAVNDSKENLVVVKRRWNSNTDDSYFSALVYDSKLNKIGDYEHILDKKQEDGILGLGQVVLHNDLTINILSSRSIKEDKTTQRIFTLVTVDSEGEVHDEDFVIPDYRIGSMSMNLRDDKSIFLAGYFYSNASKLTSTVAEGIAFFKFDAKSGEQEASEIKVFDLDFIAEGWGDRFEKAAKKKEDKGKVVGIPNLKMQDILFGEDGRIFAVGQIRYSVTTSSTVNGVTTRTTTYYYEDIVVSEFNDDGELVANNKIFYSQSSGSPIVPYRTMAYNDDFIFIMDFSKSRYVENYDELSRKEKKQYAYSVLIYFAMDDFIEVDEDNVNSIDKLLLSFQDEELPMRSANFRFYVDFDGQEEFFLTDYDQEDIVRFRRTDK